MAFLMLRRAAGDWLDVVHTKSGDLLRIRVCDIYASKDHPHVELAFEDRPRNFDIARTERGPKRATAKQGGE